MSVSCPISPMRVGPPVRRRRRCGRSCPTTWRRCGGGSRRSNAARPRWRAPLGGRRAWGGPGRSASMRSGRRPAGRRPRGGRPARGRGRKQRRTGRRPRPSSRRCWRGGCARRRAWPGAGLPELGRGRPLRPTPRAGLARPRPGAGGPADPPRPAREGRALGDRGGPCAAVLWRRCWPRPRASPSSPAGASRSPRPRVRNARAAAAPRRTRPGERGAHALAGGGAAGPRRPLRRGCARPAPLAPRAGACARRAARGAAMWSGTVRRVISVWLPRWPIDRLRRVRARRGRGPAPIPRGIGG